MLFKIGKSLLIIERRREVYNFCAELEYVFTEIYWSLDEVILELESVIQYFLSSLQLLFLQYVFIFTAGTMATAV